MQITRHKITKVIIAEHRTPVRADGLVPEDLDPALELVEVSQEAPPAYNAGTHALERTETELPPLSERHPIRLVRGWRAVALTAEQLAAIAQRAADETERTQLRALVSDLRSGTGTAAQRQVRLERCVARLIIDSYRTTP